MSKRKLSGAFDEEKQIADDAENFEKYRDVMSRVDGGWDNYEERWVGDDDDIIGRPIIYKDPLDSPFPATKGIIYKIEGPIVRICYSGQEEQHTDRIRLNQINKDSTVWKTEGITEDHILNAQMKYTPKRRGTKRRGTKRRGTKRRGTKRRGTKRRGTRTRRGRGGSRRGSRGRGRGRGIGSRGRVTRFRN